MKLYEKLFNAKSNNGDIEFKGRYPLHMPGHKRRIDAYVGDIFPYNITTLYKNDITEIEGFDNMHKPNGIIKDMEDGYSTFYNTKRTKISVNGSTACILSAISAMSEKSKHILIGRQSHKSIYNAVYINDMIPYFVYPKVEKDSGIGLEYEIEDIEAILKENKEIRSMVFTSPTYEGVIIDVKGLSILAKKYGVTLIIDEAHGSHLYFDRGIGALDSGADIVIHSLHKTMPTLTSTALLHINNNVSDDIESRIIKYMYIYQTTSPSYILMSSLSVCLEVLQNGKLKILNDKSICEIYKIRKRLKKLSKLRLFETENYDPYKIVIVTNGIREDIVDLVRKAGYEVEMSTDRYFIAMLSMMDDFISINKFVDLLINLDNNISIKNKLNYNYEKSNLNIYIDIKKLKLLDYERVLISKSLGKISNTSIYLYPPGVPLITYGERIDEKTYSLIKYYIDVGLILDEYIEVIDEKY